MHLRLTNIRENRRCSYHRSVRHVHHPSLWLWCQLQQNAPCQAAALAPGAVGQTQGCQLNAKRKSWFCCLWCSVNVKKLVATISHIVLYTPSGMCNLMITSVCGDSPCTGGWLAPPSPGVCRSPWSGHYPSCSGQLRWRFSVTETLWLGTIRNNLFI